MLFHGNLGDYSLPQLLNLIELGQKSGTLTVSREDNQMQAEQHIVLCFDDGMLLDANFDGRPINLAEKLSRAGCLDEKHVETIREQGGDMQDKAIATMLINFNYVTRREILSSIQEYMAEVIHTLLLWDDGSFHFSEELDVGKGRILVPMDLADIIVNGQDLIEEMKQLTQYLPNLNTYLELPPDPHTIFRDVELTTQEWQLVSFANSDTSLHNIARQHNISDLKIRRLVQRLERAGLIRIKGQNISHDAQQSGSAERGVNVEGVRRFTNRLRQVRGLGS